MKNPSKVAVAFVASIVINIVLAGCGNSSDGPVLSDEDKIKKAAAGRDAQMNQQGAAPAATTR